MSKLLKLSPEISPPIDALMQPIALLGNRGAGKTYAGMKLYELAHDADVQCIAIDGIGKWWGLRLAADGKASGLKDVYLFGGKRADFQITPDRGAFVARVLVERRVHAVLDVSQMRKQDRRRFLTDFAEEFHLLKKQEDQATPSVLFLEEAHQVLPQKPFGDEARMLGAFEDLIREGRNAGIGVVVMDQRPATVNKNALALVEILIALRTTYEIDRKVYVGWVVQKVADDKLKVDLEERLPFLKAGEGFLYAPMFDIFQHINIYPKRTFDSSATAKIGVKAASIGTLTPVDVERVKDAMAEVTAQVEAKDPTALKRQVAELQRQLAARPEAPVKAKTETKQVPVALKRDVVAFHAGIARLELWQTKVDKLQAEVVERCRSIEAAIGKAAIVETPTTTIATSTRQEQVHRPPSFDAISLAPLRWRDGEIGRPHAPPRIQSSRPDVPDSGIGKGERAILIAIAQYKSGVTREQISVLTGYKRSTRDAYLQRLVAAGLYEASGDFLFATKRGFEVLGPSFEPLPTGPALREHWLRELPEGERKILEVAIHHYPNPVARDDIGAATLYKRSTRDAYLQRLNNRKLVLDHGSGMVRASETLFGAA